MARTGEEDKTLRQQGDQGDPDEERMFVLVVIEGPDKGRSIVVDASQPSAVLVGQSPAAALRLTDREVSRRHLSVEARGGALRMRDLGSTNGTFVGSLRVFEAELRGGEVVSLGGTRLRVGRPGPTGSVPPVPLADHFGRTLGASMAMRRLYPLCRRIAESDVPVVVEGETGTGKEVLAEAIHEEGPRASKPFVVFDCTAVPPSLLESELFGHERGAFTSAVTARKGVFELAAGGTLLIDEIGDLDLSLQPKLLRALSRGEIRRVGASTWTKVDVRVIAATRRDLDKEIQAGRFRDDLFYRLAVARVELPPLRERKGDVTLIAKRIWRELGGKEEDLSREMLDRWEAYAWPGNVRELRNAVTRRFTLGELGAEPASTTTKAAEVDASAPAEDPIAKVLDLPFVQARDQIMRELQHRYVEALLARHGGDVARAAAASGIGRRYFQMLRARASKQE